MENSKQDWTQTLTVSDLKPIICQILNQQDVERLNWKIQPLEGGATKYTRDGSGVYLVNGVAHYGINKASWSVVVKVARPSQNPINNEPSAAEYWKREMLAYQSGLLQSLPGNLTVPRCYGIQKLPDGECRIWLEYIQEVDDKWTLDEYRLAARHLGQFNGAYLADYPLPSASDWLLTARTQIWLRDEPPDLDWLLKFSKTKYGAWISRESAERIVHLSNQRHLLVDSFNRLPTSFCHHDASRRNLMLRETASGTIKTVAIDWSYAGFGKVGEDIGSKIGSNLFFLEFDAEQTHSLDTAIYSGYLDGLQDAGWKGDQTVVRFGYTATVALVKGIVIALRVARHLHNRGPEMFETVVGYPIEDMIQQWSVMMPFLLDLGDEALALMHSI